MNSNDIISETEYSLSIFSFIPEIYIKIEHFDKNMTLIAYAFMNCKRCG